MILYPPDTEVHRKIRHHLSECGVENLSKVDALHGTESFEIVSQVDLVHVDERRLGLPAS